MRTGSQTGDNIIIHDHSSEPSNFARMRPRQIVGHTDKVAILMPMNSRGLSKNPSVKLLDGLYAFVPKPAPRRDDFARACRVTLQI
jgi:hypothetical protein